MAMLPDEVLRRFVLRARRVESHSLLREPTALSLFASGQFSGTIDLTGRTTVRRPLPADEEVFESLVARLRPLIVEAEPIFVPRVLKVIEEQLISFEEAHAELEELRSLQAEWTPLLGIQGAQSRGFSVQLSSSDGGTVTNLVSDTQLAAGWLYADLVHADPKGPKRESTDFPLVERYAAAVQFFSQMALLVVRTLDLVRRANDADLVRVPIAGWEEAVVVGVDEIVEAAEVHVAEVGSPVPDLRQSTSFGGDWKRFTVTELLRADSSNRVEVIASRPDTAPTTYESAVIRREHLADSVRLDLLVGDCAIVRMLIPLPAAPRALIEAKLEVLSYTNRQVLGAARLRRCLNEAEEVKFTGPGMDLVTPGIKVDTTDLRVLQVVTEVAEDLVAIEELAGAALSPLSGDFTDAHRIRLRQLRLIWEGHVVRFSARPEEAIVESGVPPRIMMLKPGRFHIGGVEVPTPTIVVFHPEMAVEAIGGAPDVGPNAMRYRVSPPLADRFLAWSPERRGRGSRLEDAPTAEWGLDGVDEAVTTSP